MPDKNVVLVIRPRNCHYCGNGFYALGHLVDSIKANNIDVVDLAGQDAIKERVTQAIEKYNPDIVLSFGHGSPFVYTAENEKIVFDKNNIDILANRIWHTLSCLVGQKLGMEMVECGGLAFSGYNESWYWVAEDVNQDAYKDKYAKYFFDADNTIAFILAVTKNVAEAYRAGQDKYNQYIDCWLENPDDDEYASEIAKWLIWDRDVSVVYTQQQQYVFEKNVLPIAVMGLPIILGVVASYR